MLAPYRRPETRSQRVAVLFVGLGSLAIVIGLSGWIFDIAVFRTFGLGTYPIAVWSGLCFVPLAIGILTAIHGESRTARVALVAALILPLVFLCESFGIAQLGIDHLFFPEQLARYGLPHGGRPAPNLDVTVILLALAGLARVIGGERARELTSVLACIAVIAAGTAIILVTLAEPGYPLNWLLGTALPTATVGLLFTCAIIAWNNDFAWIGQFQSVRKEWRVMPLLIPVILLAPVVPAMVQIVLMRRQLLSPLASDMIVVLCNVVVITGLVLWSIGQIARKQGAMVELTEALGSSTVAMTTMDGRITHWSKGCEETFGYSATEALGQQKYALLHSRCEQRWAQQGAPHRTEGGSGQELIETRRDGTEIAVLERVHHVETPGRDPVLVLSMTDITVAVDAIKALRGSEERLALAAAAHELGIFEWHVPSGRIDWSPGTEVRLGLAPGSVDTFEKWRARIPPEDLQLLLDIIARAVSARAEKFSYRYRLIDPRGGFKLLEGSSRAFYDAEGNLVRAIGIIIDVTAQQEREATLRAREAQLRSVLETVPDAMIVIDENGLITEFSATAEHIWGYRAADVLGKHFAMLTPADERDRYINAVEEFQTTGVARFVGLVLPGTGEAADGRRFPIEIRSGMARADDKFQFTLFFRDLSDRLSAEERLSDLNAELAHVSRQSAMSELAGDLAHELNQPLSATSNFLAAARMLIERGEDIGRATDLMRMASEQTLRAGEIIRRLRDFMAKREVDMRVESLERTVRDAVELVLVGTGQFHIRLTYDFDREARLIFADRIQVQQVLVNLLRNAMDALRNTPDSERQITIGSRKLSNQFVEIFVSDTGPGIPDSLLKQLYTRFVTTKEQSGMGIGLSISRRIVEAHGGTLSAENRPGGGATFRFTLRSMEGMGEPE